MPWVWPEEKNVMPKLSSLKQTFLFLFLFVFLGPYLWHMEVSQARGQIRAGATGLRHSNSNTRSKLCLQPTPTAHSNTGFLTH